MRTITVTCPKCREIMEVNAQTGRVEKHHAEVKSKPGGDFIKERIKGFDAERARREALVAEEREKQRTKKDTHARLFDKVKETAKEGPAERPLRDIDID